MNKKTDLSRLKETSIILANAVAIKDVGYGIAQHPFINCMFYKNFTLYEKENQRKFLNELRDKIMEQKDITGLFLLVNKPWYLTWLKLCREYLSNEDFSKWFGYAWTISEDPNNDVNVSLKEVINWFRDCRKSTIMEKEDYRIWKNIPEIITLYRGVSEGRNIYGLSYTANFEKANWFANRWNKYMYILTLNVKRKDILCYFNTRGEDEYVVNIFKYRKEIKSQL